MIPKAQHFLSIDAFNRQQIEQILNQANTWIDAADALIYPAPSLSHKTIANLFFEPSTRTRCSFELAGKRLGAQVLNFDAAASSTCKGESLLDTVDNLQAMGTDLFVIRHVEENIPAQIAAHLKHRAAVINAGDGCNQHPTQAMLDMFTIRRYKKEFNALSVAIVGDIRHSRVAHSNLQALVTLGVPDIRLIAPPSLLPEASHLPQVTTYQDLTAGLKNADVIMMLRIQQERIQGIQLPSASDYFARYGLSAEKLAVARADAIVMHPGPMNRGIEIASEVADGPQSVILKQATFGVAVRMAIMHLLLA